MFVCVIFALIYTARALNETSVPTTTAPSLLPETTTYINFAIQWKPQICYKSTTVNCYKESIPNITIHGIWPNYYDGGWPQYCEGPDLQYSDIESIETELEMYWPTLRTGVSFNFWFHEWNKHGTCWFVNATQYFEYALLWMKTESYKDIQTILSTNGIYASNENIYSLEDVTNVLSDALHQTVVIRCRNGKYIYEFFVCRHWFGQKMDCPDNLLSNCNDDVILSLQVAPDTTTTTTFYTTADMATSTSTLYITTTADITTTNDDSYDSYESDESDESDESGSNDNVSIHDKRSDGNNNMKSLFDDNVFVLIFILIIVLVLICIALYIYVKRKDNGGRDHEKIKKSDDEYDDEYSVDGENDKKSLMQSNGENENIIEMITDESSI